RDLDTARTFTTSVKAAAGKKADVAVLLSAPNVVEAIRFLDGDHDLATPVAALKSLPLDGAFPTDSPAKLLRRGTIICGAGDMCTLTLVLPGDAKPVK
ncbi:MAG TPA: hypothetical protein VH138_12375, partial [Vicinamibacterales bacterium]|nr:hypothetical protein [Vicinamibacterales bacterium]